MEKLVNEFVIHRPIDDAWTVLTDLERIAPCMPGAQLQEIQGAIYRGVVKVKLGAISTVFKGEAHFVERDDEGHKAVLHGEGRDTTGKGNADAMITATLQSIDANRTKCVVETDLRVTGKVAQFGRGIMGDVSKKLMAQFATNLNTMLDASGQPLAPAAAPASGATQVAAPVDAIADASSVPPVDASVRADPTTTTGTPTVRKIECPANEPIELSGLAGTAVLKRLLPALGGFVLLMLVLRRLRK